MRNEIFASYGYRFKGEKWQDSGGQEASGLLEAQLWIFFFRYRLGVIRNNFNYLLEMEAIKDERIIYVRGACDRFFDEEGNFHLELFDRDMLHMSDQGYKVWNEILSPYLK